MRWQSRGLFWSAIDAKQSAPELRVSCSDFRLAFVHWWKTVREIGRRHPAVYLAPLILGCVCLAGGIVGVALAAKAAQQEARDDARVVASQAAAALAVLLDGGSLQPGASLGLLAAEQPGMAGLLQVLPRLAPRLLQQAPAGAIRELWLAPFGVVAAILAPSTAGTAAIYTAAGSGVGAVGVGAGLLSRSETRPDLLRAIRTQGPAQSAPQLLHGSDATRSEALLATHHPVYVTGAAPDEAWGNSAGGGGIGAADCAGLCYFPRLTIPAPGSDPLLLAESQPAPPSGGGAQTVAVAVPMRGLAEAAQPTLTLHHSDGWRPAWEGPLYAVVVLLSLALAGLLFAVLLNHWRHRAMLRAMLPEKASDGGQRGEGHRGRVLSVLGTGSLYYQHFDCVTVLYADVVRYSAAKHQEGGGLPPLEVVKLLNDVHSMYEAVIDKYGLVRIRRSGESFMVVGGCPTPDDPVTVAARVAACARDMMLATARYTGSRGLAVQLRVGLHSGPVVAAVVGTKMPRFSLFGDVVDVAYFMEATSRAMAVHVSDRTSQLLATAGACG
ncbi:hypothetical protein GPECTOR_16g645 [Gonium pectorale]|uniref:Guanylate cyclase domain-containing protein n=1 Tax=Gonium pectorale TaxID=33097 RepID=A0A150GL01_GONPE|nr:hypothetical protein GPECTOR_16g645 [Gonium pectorale]|eukprot:KXZ50471.1 hypothetical protein GPECTOR_16g645 [Gonium pectorale]